jgi:VWFA-related protein
VYKPLALIWLLFAAIAPAQQIAPTQQIVPPAAPANSQVKLAVVVTPGSGAPVAGLRQQDFTVLDNKVAQPITSFQAVTGQAAPVEAVVVVDALNIVFMGLGREQYEIAGFFHADGGRLALPTALVIFSENGLEVLGGPTLDGNALAKALADYKFKPRTLRRSQGFYGAEDRFEVSLRGLEQLVASMGPRPGRKLVLWISPGWPILSGPGVQLGSTQQDRLFQGIVQMSARLREARITLYSIDSVGVGEPLGRTYYYQAFQKGISKPSQVAVGNLSLQVLAVQSGGLALSSTGVAGLLKQCVADASAYYELSFNALPAEKHDEYHHIEIKVAGPGMVARTRQGYYAEP